MIVAGGKIEPLDTIMSGAMSSYFEICLYWFVVVVDDDDDDVLS